MANPYQQKAQQRKWIYLGLVLALLTVSIVQRKWVVEKQANDLQLRETTRGEVELTGSAVRLMLTGSRGLAVPILWQTAIEMQKKHQWSELQLVVGSITKLQPYFITPWLFQSWNMAFNVAVEFDRPFDKYYYISKGLELMAEGERRNQGSGDEVQSSEDGKTRFPGHPELRHHMGFTYQLKIGNSDEKTTMRCLLEMSTVHPSERNADDFWTHDERGRKRVKATEFDRFCEEHPRLIKRLRDSHLRMTSREQIVDFLEKNKDVPTRFVKGSKAGKKDSLEEPRRQFPILPPSGLKRGSWPDTAELDYSLDGIAEDGRGETFDVFLVCRTWYEYAQMPLPPPNPNPGAMDQDYDRLRHRMPKAMAVQIFRSYPARAQVYIAETLQAEGWFDEEGWALPAWKGEIDAPRLDPVGAKPKYDTARGWRRGYDRYLQHGIASGLYLFPEQVEKLEKDAQRIRDEWKVKKGDRLPPLRADIAQTEIGKSHFAHMKLIWNEHYRQMCNFDAHINQSEGEMDPLTVAARKLLYQAEREWRFEKAPDVAVTLYEEAWPLWIHVNLKHPKFAAQSSVQEDAYEANWQYVRISQRARAHLFQPTLMAMAQFAAWPYPSWEEWRWLESSQKVRIIPIKDARGPIEGVQYYDGPQAAKVKEYLLYLTTTAGAYKGTAFAIPVLFPDQQNYVLTRWAWRDQRVLPGWKQMVPIDAIRNVRNRLGLPSLETAAAKGP
jgi:hypothetical protein